MKRRGLLLALSCAALSLAAGAMDVVLLPDGRMDFAGRELRPFAFLKDWQGTGIAGGYEITTPGTARFRLANGRRKLFDATVSLSKSGDGEVRVDCSFTAAEAVETENIGCTMALPRSDVSGLAWRAGTSAGVFAPPKNGGLGVCSGEGASFEFATGPGRSPLRVRADRAFRYLVQDNSKWSPEYIVRLGALKRRRFEAGETFALSFTVSAPGESLAPRDTHVFEIRAGGDWVPLDYRRDIEPGSALDFSRMGFVDAPAGRHGWLKNVGGHFEFEGLPGRAQRFYGVNLCGTANFPDHALAERLVARFKRLGYNAIRLHHHDAWTVDGSADGLALNDANMERLDYFVAAAIREGLYVTTDMYVSRARKIKWRHIGVDRDGTVDMQLFKALCAVYDPAFENWAAYASNFMSHVNRYTGRRYADEPAMPLVSLVNEGGLFMGWTDGVRDDPRVLASWKAWLEAKRAEDPSFAPGLDADALPPNFWKDGIHPAVAQWTGEIEARMVARMKERLRGLGCKALLTNGNCGPHYAPLQLATDAYDYIDDHFYVDHPEFPEKPWSLPSKCPNENPLLGTKRLAPSGQAFTRMFGKPFTMTEWNFSGPGRYRGVGGILTGAMAALQDWDGLWRFAYSHSRDCLGDADVRSPGYFDLAADPLAQASERACLCLFLRGDLEPYRDGVALWVTPESAASAKKTHWGAPSWSDAAWTHRVGSCLSPEDAKPLHVLRREEAEGSPVKPFEGGAGALRIDRARGSFVIDTPRTCGGFAEKGRIDAGTLVAEVSGAPATVWVHSLDGEAVNRSKRLLLTHLTDVQGEGARFSDATMKTTLKWGGRPLVQNGAADVELALDEPGAYTVHALATNGRRVGVVPSEAKDGRLRFRAEVRGPEGARILYEIVR